MKYVIDFTNTGYIEDGVLVIDTENKCDDTQFTIEKISESGESCGIKQFDFEDLYNNEKE